MSSVAPARTDAFRDALGAMSLEPAATDLRHYRIDGLDPSLAVAPSSEEQVAEVLALAQSHGLAVCPFGAGNCTAVGNIPHAYDLALDTSELNQTIEHEPDDVTVTVDAGVSLGTLQRALAQHGQRLSIDPSCDNGATIGGLLAANAYGPARHAFGTLRDWVIGMRIAHTDGSVTKSGGRVVKNVSGYDMHKLHIGALGTLGIITQATFKLAPLPHTVTTAIFTAETPSDACALVMRGHDTGLAVEAAEVLSPAGARTITGLGGWAALIRVAGSQAAVDRSLHDLRAMAADLHMLSDEAPGAGPWTSWNQAFAPSGLAMRVSVLPSAVALVLHALEERFPSDATISATVTAGVIRVCLSDGGDSALGAIEATREVATANAGFALVDSAPPDVKRGIDVFGAPRPDFAVMQRLKEQFDPQRTLSPGRYLGRL